MIANRHLQTNNQLMNNQELNADRHNRVRRQHARELAQDYVEAIYQFQAANETCIRVTDLQNRFGVSHVTVIRALQRLESQGLVLYSAEKRIQLTKEGEAVAKRSAERHQLVVDLLCALGVSGVQAEADAEGAEHHFSEETLAAIRQFLRRGTKNDKNRPECE